MAEIPDWAQETAPVIPDWATNFPENSTSNDVPLSTNDYHRIFPKTDHKVAIEGMLNNYMEGINSAANSINNALSQNGQQLVANAISPFLSDEQQSDLKATGKYYQTPVADEIKNREVSPHGLLDEDEIPSPLEDAARQGLEKANSVLGPYAGTVFSYMAPLSGIFQSGENSLNQATGSKLPGELFNTAMNIAGIAGYPEPVKSLMNQEILPPEPKTAPTVPVAPEGELIEGNAPQLPAPESAQGNDINVNQETPDWAQDDSITSDDIMQREHEARYGEKFYIRPSDSKDSFNVVDGHGDHVQGGFDSRAAAEDYIESAKAPAIGDEPEEWGNEITPYELPAVHEDAPPSVTQQVAAISPKMVSPVDQAASEVNTQPTPAQIEAGNYKKGHVNIQGLDVTIENPRGSERSGIDADGKPWAVTMPDHYGYIKDTKGMDGEHVDAYIGPNTDSQKAFIIDQVHADTGVPDEHKVMLGYDTPVQAISQYEKAFSDGKGTQRIGAVTSTNIDSLKDWLATNATKKPASKQSFATEKIPEGQQTVIPGAEAITNKDLAERQMEKPIQSPVAQKPMDSGLFDVAGRGQQDLLNLAGQGEKSNVTAVTNKTPIATGGSEAGSVSARNALASTENTSGNAGNQVRSTSSSASGLSEIPKVKTGVIPPSKIGKPTSLHTFLKNNGAKVSENNQLVHMKDEVGKINKFDLGHDRATELAHQAGYFPERPSVTDLQNALLGSNGGREHYRNQDVDRILKSQENAQQKQQDDPVYIEHYADRLGLDTDKKPDESAKQFINRLKKAIQQFHKDEEGSFPSSRYKRAGLPNNKPAAWALKKPIETIERAVGKLTGNTWQKIGNAYTKVMAPELVSGKALRADAYLAKHKAAISEARNALYKQSAEAERAWDRATDSQREQFLEDQDTGNFTNNNPNDPAHTRYKALTDATHKAESAVLGRNPDKGYRDNYFPRIWEKPEEVRMYLHSPAMIKKYGPGWFNKAREFDLYREAKQAGFKLATNNPETLLQMRLMAGQDMIARMGLLRDLERDGIATPARAFSIDKRIAKTGADLANATKKYNEAFNKINDPKQTRWSFADPAVRKYTKILKDRMDKHTSKLAEYKQEKTQYKLPDTTLAGLKNNGFKIIGPDDKVWHLDNDMIPLWKNVMDSQGLWENKGLTGSAYRGWQALRNTWVPIKLGLSLFHPMHVASIHVANGLAEAARNLTQGGKGIDSAHGITSALKMGFGLKGLKGGEAIKAWNKPAGQRTVAEQQIVDTMNEGGFVPKMSERDIAVTRRSFENALHGNLAQKAVVLPIKGAQGIIRSISAPIFEHWIPALKTEAYLMRARNVIIRDPSLATDAGRRGEVLRQIAKDTDRTYGEMNYDTLFWNKAVRDAFNASFLSGGWKLAQLYYARGLAAPFKMAYKFAKSGEFNPKDISHNMMFSYIYGAMGLALGAAFTKMMGGQVNSLADMVFPQTGEKDKDGKPIRVSLPFFNKEGYSIARDMNERGLIAGSLAFAYDQTLFKGIVDTLSNKDYMGRPLISDPSDLNQWAHQAWETVKPITLDSYQKAEAKGSKFGENASLVGIGMAPAYASQSPFEQKVLYTYDKENPPKGDSYTASLKSDYRAALAKGDDDKMNSLKQEMAKQGMTPMQIASLNKNYNKPFVEHAWSMLPAIEQRRIYDSASDEEKSKYRLKPLRGAQ